MLIADSFIYTNEWINRLYRLHEGGVSVPRTKSLTPLHTKPEGRRLAGEPQRLQGWPAHQDTSLVHSRNTAQGSKPCLITHSRANLSLKLIKLVLRTKDMTNELLYGLEVFLGVCMTSSNSSELKWPGELIYIGHQLELAVRSR